MDSPDPSAQTSHEPVDELHLSRTMDGRYLLNGTFSSDTGDLLAAALDGEVDRSCAPRGTAIPPFRRSRARSGPRP